MLQITDFILKQKIIFLDGAIGTLLHSSGYDYSSSIERFILQHKDLYISILKEYEKSGSSIIYTPTLLSNNIFFSKNKISREDGKQMIKDIITLMKEHTNCYIFGCIGSVDPNAEYTNEELNNIYCDQIDAFIETKVDGIIIETQTSLRIAKFLVDKTRNFFSVFITFSLDDRGKTFDNKDITECYQELENDIAGFGVNCTSFEGTLQAIRKLNMISKVPLIAKPNMGIDGKEKMKTKEEFTDFCINAYKCGAKLIGGCCGSSPVYIQHAKSKLFNII